MIPAGCGECRRYQPDFDSLLPGNVTAGHDLVVLLSAAMDRDRMRGAPQVGQRRVDRRLTPARGIEVLQQEGRHRRGVITGPFMDDDDLASQGIARGDGDRRLAIALTEDRQGIDARILSLTQPQRDLLVANRTGNGRRLRYWRSDRHRSGERRRRSGCDRNLSYLQRPDREVFELSDFACERIRLTESGSDPDVRRAVELRRIELRDEHAINGESSRVAGDDDLEDVAPALLETQRRHGATSKIGLQTDLILPRSIRRHGQSVVVAILLLAEGDAEVPRSIGGVAGIDELDPRHEVFDVDADWRDRGRTHRLRQ